jgi:hypothetical protein
MKHDLGASHGEMISAASKRRLFRRNTFSASLVTSFPSSQETYPTNAKEHHWADIRWQTQSMKPHPRTANLNRLAHGNVKRSRELAMVANHERRGVQAISRACHASGQKQNAHTKLSITEVREEEVRTAGIVMQRRDIGKTRDVRSGKAMLARRESHYLPFLFLDQGYIM